MLRASRAFFRLPNASFVHMRFLDSTLSAAFSFISIQSRFVLISLMFILHFALALFIFILFFISVEHCASSSGARERGWMRRATMQTMRKDVRRSQVVSSRMHKD